MALLYAQFGTMEFGKLAVQATRADAGSLMLLAGTIMVTVGIGFKLALVPFHMWTPDVYEGAPAPVTAFVATVSKGAVFGLLLRYFGRPDIQLNYTIFLVFSVIAIASMFIGNLLALFQTNVKRILAYSSIAHMGYLLVAFLAGGPFMVTSVTFYFIAYFLTTLVAFGIIIFLSGSDSEADTMDHYRSLAWSRPWTTGIFTAALLSLAGIPLTAGFLGKFYLLSAGVSSSLWFLVIMLVFNSAIGLFYYLRIIQVMFHGPEEDTGDHISISSSLSSAGGLVLAVLLFLILWLGIYPGPVIEIIRQLVISR
jgi:NADH-quinone oxidoreductase subunit N